tara:strand:+ start:2703 stop:4061 length:1359 start_codon:yes stop_codon:yes gene_type:complete
MTEVDFFDLASNICEDFKNNDKDCYIVGGTVRDSFIGRDVKDLDLATDATPDEIKAINTDAGRKTFEVGERFGTIVALVEGEPVEITTFRSEGDYSDGRRPEYVHFESNIETDLARRDFTMNALAYDPLTKETVDPFGGKEDIQKRIIRAVGDADTRFKEDSLRPVRGCRFTSTLDFDIEPETKAAMKRTAHEVSRVSRERLRDEFLSIMASEKPSVGLNCLRESGILKEVYPELDAMVGVEQPKQYHLHDVWGHTMKVVDALPQDNVRLRLAGLLHDVAKPVTKDYHHRITFRGHEEAGEVMAEEFAQRNQLPKQTREYLKSMVRYHLFPYEDNWKDETLRKFIMKVGEENFDDLMLLRQADLSAGRAEEGGAEKFKQKIEARLQRMGEEGPLTFEMSDLAIGGHDVMRLKSIGAGPEIGQYLSTLHEWVLQKPSRNTRAALEEKLSEMDL